MALDSVQASLLADRYRLRRVLKQGAGISTWSAVDEKTGGAVVAKVGEGRTVSRGHRLRLEHEAALLRRVRSPHLVPLVGAGSDGDRLYVVTRRIEGKTFQQVLQERRVEVREGLDLARDLLRGLSALHRNHVLHRDLKPANVMLQAPDKRAVVLDLGLARSQHLDGSIRDLPVGTVLYMSPEQAGLLDQDVGARSDLYSLGALLYHGLAGRPPFEGRSPGEVLRRHLVEEPRPLRSVRPEVPRAVAEVVERLLRKDPRDRYQSAEALLADLDEVAAALEQGCEDPSITTGRRDRRQALADPQFVGRATELQALAGRLAAARAGRRQVVVLTSPSGTGKSRLLDEFAVEALRQGPVHVARARGRTRSSRAPLEVLHQIVNSVIGNLEVPDWERIRGELGGAAAAVAEGFPALAGPLGVPGGPAGRPEHARDRLREAAVRLLGSLGTSCRPLLVLLDDLQWADELTLQCLEALARREPTESMLLVCAVRDDLGTDGARGLPADQVLHLDPLPAEEILRLARSMAGALSEEAETELVRLSGGSPFMAQEALQGLVEGGSLVPGNAGWNLRPGLASNASHRAGAVLASRLATLGDEVFRGLRRLAVLGREFDLDSAAAALGESPLPVLESGRARHFLWLDRSGTRYSFVHDRIRETLLEALPDEEGREVHASLAEHLERQGGEGYRVAWHLCRAGRLRQALPHALAAAREARSRLDFDLAAELCQMAREGVDPAKTQESYEVHLEMGEIEYLRGRYQEAREALGAASRVAREPLDQARVRELAARTANRQGQYPEATELYLEALQALGHPVPRNAAQLALRLAQAGVERAVRALAPLPGSIERESSNEVEVTLHSYLSQSALQGGRELLGLWAQIRRMSLTEEGPEDLLSGYELAERAIIYACLGLRSVSRRCCQRAERIQAQLEQPWERGRILAPCGFARSFTDGTAAALERFQSAERLVEGSGDLWEVAALRYHHGLSLMRLGRFRESFRQVRSLNQLAVEAGDEHHTAMAIQAWNLLALQAVDIPEPPPAHQRMEEEEFGPATRVGLRKAEGFRLLRSGDPVGARRAFEQALQAGRGLLPYLQENLETLCWLVTSLRVAARKDPPLLQVARRHSREAIRRARRLAAFRAHALREAALLAAERGHLARARRLIEESLQEARREGQPYEEALSLLAAARLLDSEEAAESLREGLRTLGRLGGRRPLYDEENPSESAVLSLADRFDGLLEAGRRIAGALERPRVYEAARDAAHYLLRAQESLILERGPHVAAGPEGADYSRSLVEKTFETGELQVLDEAPEARPEESVVLQGLRSALCVPLQVHGQAEACLYLSHRGLSGLFGEEERRIARYIASFAGVALETATLLEERSHYTTALQASEARFRTLVGAAGTGIATMDQEGALLDSNEALQQLLGLEPSALRGRLLESLVYHQDVRDVSSDFRDLRDGPARRTAREVRVLRSSGEVAWAHLVMSLLPHRPESHEFAILSLSDVTPRRVEEVVRFQERERRLLSSELHDGVSQEVAVLLLGLERSRILLDRDPGAIGPVLEEIRESARQVLDELSGLIFSLRTPMAEEEMDLESSLQVLLDEFRSRCSTEVVPDLDLPEEGPKGLAAHFAYRIVQEALNNVRRHSQASQVEVRVALEDGHLVGTVRDDGRGCDLTRLPADQGRRKHFGLVGMRERANLLGGTLELRSSPGRGMDVAFTLPCTPARPASALPA